MKICFFIASLNNSGGTERALTAVAGELIKSGHDISIICWWGGTASFFQLDNRIACYSVYANKEINIYTNYLPTLFKYKKLINQLKPDVIIDVCIPLSLISIPATRFTSIRVVSWEQFNVKVSWNFFTAKAARWLASRFSTFIIVLTHTDKEEYRKRFHASNQFVIPNPVSMAVSHVSPLTSNTVLAVGRLTHQKGFDLLLKSWHNLVNNPEYLQYQDWKLNIVGGGEDEVKLKKLCTELKLDHFVNFIQPTRNIELLYVNASVFVMSSRFEGLPLALIEAKAFGLPTISFDCETGPREVITHEEDGLLVEADNYISLSAAILRLIKSRNERERFAAKSIEKAKKYELKVVMQSWTEMLNNL